MFKEQIREIVISDNVHASMMNPIIQDLLKNTMENRASKIDEILQNGTQVTFKANGIIRGIISTSGRSLEYEWDGTSLGVRQEGEAEYQFVDLKGDKGDQGIQGERGLQGERGIQGIQGEKGLTGDKGIQGEQGIQGKKGDTGDGLHIDGLADSVEELPQGETTGTCYLVGTTLYYFNGTTWDEAGSIQGPQGKQGIQGERGVDGAPGIQGERGLDGAKGDKGDQGIQGPKGDTGAKGATGSQGPAGPVNISDAINGTSSSTAASQKAVKTAYDRAEQAFQSASNGKTVIATAITGKGVAASGSDTHQVLANKIDQIKTTGDTTVKLTYFSSIPGWTLKELAIPTVDLSKTYFLIRCNGWNVAATPNYFYGFIIHQTYNNKLVLCGWSKNPNYAISSYGEVTIQSITSDSIKSVQRGLVSVSSLNVTISISSVNPSKSLVILNGGSQYTGTSNPEYAENIITGFSNTLINVKAGGYVGYLDYQVVEFY